MAEGGVLLFIYYYDLVTFFS